MKTLVERLNFSQSKDDENAVLINKKRDINFYETLCLYCADNNICIDNVEDSEFMFCSEVIAYHGIEDERTDHFYFWIDADK